MRIDYPLCGHWAIWAEAPDSDIMHQCPKCESGVIGDQEQWHRERGYFGDMQKSRNIVNTTGLEGIAIRFIDNTRMGLFTKGRIDLIPEYRDGILSITLKEKEDWSMAKVVIPLTITSDCGCQHDYLPRAKGGKWCRICGDVQDE